MNIGPLNTRCRIEQQVQTIDPTYGSTVTAWSLLGTFYCKLQDERPSRSEAIKQGLKVDAKRARLWLGYNTLSKQVTTDMRVIINRASPEVYQIISPPAVLGDKDGIEVMIERVSTDG